jgi:hypothetical protein
LSDPWTFEPEGDNALVIKAWRAAPERPGDPPESYAAVDVDDSEWQEVVAGAWAYQLPAEPVGPWPIAVWYRIAFEVDELPERLALLVDGFYGEDASVWMNGQIVETPPTRSHIDSQMKELELHDHARVGRNLLAARLVLRDPTGGLVDHVKILGAFELATDGMGSPRIVAASEGAEPVSWTERGYPFFSGRGAYRTTFAVPQELAGRPLLLEVPMHDDVLEVEVNGRQAGVRLWDPYVVDVSDCVSAGENSLTLRVANTPANLLNGVARPSGLAGTPRLRVSAGDDGSSAALPVLDETQ